MSGKRCGPVLVCGNAWNRCSVAVQMRSAHKSHRRGRYQPADFNGVSFQTWHAEGKSNFLLAGGQNRLSRLSKAPRPHHGLENHGRRQYRSPRKTPNSRVRDAALPRWRSSRFCRPWIAQRQARERGRSNRWLSGSRMPLPGSTVRWDAGSMFRV
jgi:hypothetical protein